MGCDTSCSGDDKIFVGTVGLRITVDVCSDINDASLVRLDARKPDGTEVEWIGYVTEDTKITYDTQSGDLDQAGEYRIQSYVEMYGFLGNGKTDRFKVYEDYG